MSLFGFFEYFCRVGIVPGRALAAHQTGAASEHITGVRHSSSAPTIAHIDGPQISATFEHFIHIGYLGRVEVA